MTAFIFIVTILQTFSISLGVGSSTLAIVNFFVAISDGVIDEAERRMMGIVYFVLRLAMVIILVTTGFLIFNDYISTEFTALSTFSIGQLIILFVLFLNSILMTARIIPSTFGPAIQAGSWYSLGLLSSLQILNATDFSLTTFLIGYIFWIILAIVIVNSVMAILKSRKNN